MQKVLHFAASHTRLPSEYLASEVPEPFPGSAAQVSLLRAGFSPAGP